MPLMTPPGIVGRGRFALTHVSANVEPRFTDMAGLSHRLVLGTSCSVGCRPTPPEKTSERGRLCRTRPYASWQWGVKASGTRPGPCFGHYAPKHVPVSGVEKHSTPYFPCEYPMNNLCITCENPMDKVLSGALTCAPPRVAKCTSVFKKNRFGDCLNRQNDGKESAGVCFLVGNKGKRAEQGHHSANARA